MKMMAARPAARVLLITGALLLVPFLAMQFGNQVQWTGSDFVVAGVLIATTGFAYEVLARKARDSAYRFGAGIAVVSALMLVWVNLAVGIIGNEDNPANLMYLAVLAVGVIGAVVSRLKARGMARTLFAMAVVQVIIAAIALLTNHQQSDPHLTYEIVGVTAMFVVLFVTSGALFLGSEHRIRKSE